MGITQHVSGSKGSGSSATARACGNVGRNGAGLMPIRGHFRSAGGAGMGLRATAPSSAASASTPRSVAALSQQWASRCRTDGLTAPRWSRRRPGRLDVGVDVGHELPGGAFRPVRVACARPVPDLHPPGRCHHPDARRRRRRSRSPSPPATSRRAAAPRRPPSVASRSRPRSPPRREARRKRWLFGAIARPGPLRAAHVLLPTNRDLAPRRRVVLAYARRRVPGTDRRRDPVGCDGTSVREAGSRHLRRRPLQCRWSRRPSGP